MDDTTSFILDHTEEDILTPTVSDEALEAAGTDGGYSLSGEPFVRVVASRQLAADHRPTEQP
jgi:hypothetical protein